MFDLENSVRHHRFHAGEVTQQALADALGVSRQTIVYIEKGRFNPSVRLALLMARYFNTTVENLFSLKVAKHDNQGKSAPLLRD
jgi:putative transcriptional regulator